MKILETERLILRHFEISDAEDLFRIYSDSETMKFMGDGPPTLEAARENLKTRIDKYSKTHGPDIWAAVLKKNNRFIGRCGLLRSTINGNEETEVGYLIDRDFWGRNIATEAARGVLDFAFNQLEIGRIVALIHPENIASKKVAEKVGMTFEKIVSYKNFPEVLLFAKENN
jgi:ribosomal-protein-alanine N-acetyltransferase